jgi:hypothetical protein
MKPTPRQKYLIEVVENQASFWMNTNDIDSPTHYSDMEEEVSKLEWDGDHLTKEDAKKFEDLIGDLFDFIKARK